MLIKDFYFFKEETEVKDSEAIPNSKGNILVIRVDSETTFEIEIEGCLDLETEPNKYNSLAAISMNDLKVHTSIIEPNVYQIDISGCKKVKASIISLGEGSLTVYGIIKEG